MLRTYPLETDLEDRSYIKSVCTETTACSIAVRATPGMKEGFLQLAKTEETFETLLFFRFKVLSS